MKKAVVIDDEPFVVKSLCHQLESIGFETTSAANRDDAIREITKSRPDLVVTDIMMPFLGGFEVVEFVKDDPAFEKTKVVVVSGMDQDTYLATLNKADAYIPKPFNSEDFKNKVQTLFAS